MKIPLVLIAAALAHGCAPAAPDIAITDAWARATAPGQTSAAAYATIANRGGADRLVGVSAPGATAMIHHSDQQDGIARMRMIDALPIPAGGEVTLAPGATHVMLAGLAAPLTAGSEVPLTFRFATGGSHTVRVAVVAPGAR